MSRLTNFSKILFFIFICLIIPAIFGYVKCWIKFIDSDFDGTKTTFKREVVYGIGLIPPIGCFVGWINVEDQKIDQ
jgi:hypothetical protein